MPVSVEMLEPPSLVNVRMHGQVTADDIRQMLRRVLMLAQDAPLYLLVDIRELVSMPRNTVNLFVSMREYARFVQHPNVRALAFVGADPTVRLSIETLMRSLRHIMTDSLDAGLAFLRESLASDSSA